MGGFAFLSFFFDTTTFGVISSSVTADSYALYLLIALVTTPIRTFFPGSICEKNSFPALLLIYQI